MKKIICFLFFMIFGVSFYLFAQNILYEKGTSRIIEYLEFREVDIKDVLRQLSKQYSLNIIFSESVEGLITVQLQDLSIEEALDSIITINGFVYTKKGRVIKVTTSEEAEREGKQTQIFTLNNADASQLKDTLGKVLSSEGTIEADTRSNSLIIADNPGVISKIEDMVPLLDKITPQVLIEAKFIELSLTVTEKLGIEWENLITSSLANDSFTFPYSLSSEFKFDSTDSVNTSFATLDFTEVQGVFNFLKTSTDSSLVASPRIVTLDNQEASINVGKVIPLPTYTYNDDQGAWEITGWEEYHVGVNLKVTPHVSPSGYIKLKLKPVVSSILEWIGEAGDLNRRPVTATREVETEVQIKDGQTVVIGGLIKTEESTVFKKIPFLGDIPLIGWVFRNKTGGTQEDPQDKTDLLIFVTASIVKQEEKELLAFESTLTTSPSRPFKMDLRKVLLK
ncbi:MAG: secretin and TonB N-terminal domain-containing protein [Candidatus Omnitrophica bacterium]|nr:secretin and TonB N-terminal domain-containing protein [Candidatus Omnitrophota bacterium]